MRINNNQLTKHMWSFLWKLLCL